jgi:ABC-type lipoprotein export system ATPase subunit
MITLQNVTKTYALGRKRFLTALDDINLQVNQGEFWVISGRSGAGKTTLLNLISGLTRPSSGCILWDGTEIWSYSDKERSHLRNQRIGFIFQFPSLLRSLTALENVLLPDVFGPHRKQSEIYERATMLLEMVGLSDKLNAYPYQLSAGEQQRVVIARSLIRQPEVLLADEPTSDLDEKTEREMIRILQELHKTAGVTMLLVTHAVELVEPNAHVLKLANGTVVS